MKQKRPVPRLTLEPLEDRWCPALSILQTSTALTISGSPSSTTLPLSVTATAPGTNTFRIMDGNTNLGTWKIGASLQFNLTSEPNDVDLNLNGGYIPGNVLFSLGNGFVGSPANIPFASVNVSSGTTTPVAGGTIRGTLTFQGGRGQETNINVGGFQATIPPAFTPVTITPITINGDLIAKMPENANGFGNGLVIHAGTLVVGSVQATNIDTLTLGDLTTLFRAATVGGDLSATDASSHHSMSVDLLGNVNGNVSVNAAGTTAGFNEFTLQQQTAGTGGSVGNLLTVSLGASANGNLFTVAAGTTVTGNATLINGSTSTVPVNSIFDLEGTFDSSLTLNLGYGDNLVESDTGFIFGNLSISGGDGNDTISGKTAAAFDATIGGTLTVNLGNGNNVADIGLAPGGIFYWTSGGGSDSVALDPDGGVNTPGFSQLWNVNFHFGNGDDTVNLVDAVNPQSITGLIDMGGRINGNVYLQGNNWNPLPTFQLKNVP